MSKILLINQVKVGPKQVLDSVQMAIVVADKKKCKTKHSHCTCFMVRPCKKHNLSTHPIRLSWEPNWDGPTNKPRNQTGLTAAQKFNYPKTPKKFWSKSVLSKMIGALLTQWSKCKLLLPKAKRENLSTKLFQRRKKIARGTSAKLLSRLET